MPLSATLRLWCHPRLWCQPSAHVQWRRCLQNKVLGWLKNHPGGDARSRFSSCSSCRQSWSSQLGCTRATWSHLSGPLSFPFARNGSGLFPLFLIRSPNTLRQRWPWLRQRWLWHSEGAGLTTLSDLSRTLRLGGGCRGAERTSVRGLALWGAERTPVGGF